MPPTTLNSELRTLNPSATLAVDFETYYDRDYSLKKLDAWSYVHHPKFDAYLMSVYGVIESRASVPLANPAPNVGQASSLSTPAPSFPDSHSSNIQQSTSHNFSWVGHPKDFQCWEMFEGALLVAHNAAFDSLVFRRLQELGVIPSVLNPNPSLNLNQGGAFAGVTAWAPGEPSSAAAIGDLTSGPKGGARSPSALAPIMSPPSDSLGCPSSAAGGEKSPVPVPSSRQSTNPVFHPSNLQGRAQPPGAPLPSIKYQVSSFNSPTWRCTASLAVYLQAPRNLKGACKQLLGIEVDKTQRTKACGKTTGDLFENEAMTDYALEDARLCYLLWEKFNHLWPEDEQELATLTFEWGQAGIGVDFQTLEKSIKTLERQRFDAAQLLPWVDDFTEDTPLSHRQLALECRKANIPAPASLAMDSPLCEAWEEKYGAEYPWVNAMRIFRRTNMLLSRFYTIRSRSIPTLNHNHNPAPSTYRRRPACNPAPSTYRRRPACNPAPSQTSHIQHSTSHNTHTSYRFPYALKYFGAVPGRWSGDAGFNVQNMPRGELFGVDLRKCFQPSDGCVFVIADLSQIEPRILAWLIDDHEFLSLVRSGIDIYEAHARSTMGYTDPAPLKDTDSKMRSLAKARVLGLGYGCGPKKFVSVAKNLGGIEISFAEAKQTVADFRAKNPKISRLWNCLDRAFKRSAGGDYSIELPSGRHLQYFDVHKTDRGYFAARTVRGGRVRSLYGGLLCENLVQATARDLFAWHLLAIHRALNPAPNLNLSQGRACSPGAPPEPAPNVGQCFQPVHPAPAPNSTTPTHHHSHTPVAIGRVVFHVHDEVIVEVPKEQAEQAKDRILEIMSTTPEWLSGCPVAAEAGVFTHYTK